MLTSVQVPGEKYSSPLAGLTATGVGNGPSSRTPPTSALAVTGPLNTWP